MNYQMWFYGFLDVVSYSGIHFRDVWETRDPRTEGRMDKASHRDVSTHLKSFFRHPLFMTLLYFPFNGVFHSKISQYKCNSPAFYSINTALNGLKAVFRICTPFYWNYLIKLPLIKLPLINLPLLKPGQQAWRFSWLAILDLIWCDYLQIFMLNNPRPVYLQ